MPLFLHGKHFLKIILFITQGTSLEKSSEGRYVWQQGTNDVSEGLSWWGSLQFSCSVEYLWLLSRQAWHLLQEQHMAGGKHCQCLQRCAYMYPGQGESECTVCMQIWHFSTSASTCWDVAETRKANSFCPTFIGRLFFSPSSFAMTTFPGANLSSSALDLVPAFSSFGWWPWLPLSTLYLRPVELRNLK